jgi:hypothetical protein
VFKNFLLFVCIFFSVTCFSIDISRIDFRRLSPNQKIQVIADFKEFVETFHQSEFKNRVGDLKVIFHFFNQSYAGWGEACLIGGWPSTTDGAGRCFRPQGRSGLYEKYKDRCGANQLYCNPTLFGKDICVPFSSRDDIRSSYQNCNNKFSELERTLDDVIVEVDQNEFLELTQTASHVCNYTSKSVTGMCANLKDKLSRYITDETSLFVKNLITAKNSGDQEDIVTALSNAHARINELSNEINSECNDENLSQDKLLHCQKIAKEFELLEKYSNELIAYVETNDPTLLDQGNCDQSLPTIGDPSLSETVVEASNIAGCSLEEIRVRDEECQRELMCAGTSSILGSISFGRAALSVSDYLGYECISSKNDCVTNMASALLKNITDLLGGVWGLLSMAGNWVVDKAGDFWTWATGAEDASSDKQLAIAGLSGEEVDQIKEDPVRWYQKLWKGIVGAIESFMKEHVGCSRWQGVPHYSKCLEPFKGFECMNCKTYLTGACTVAGYILPEIFMLVASGGIGNLAKGGANAARLVTQSLKATGQFKRITGAIRANPILNTLARSGGRVVQAGGIVGGYIAGGFSALAKAFKALGTVPGIKQTKDLIVKINEKVSSKIGETAAGRFQRDVNAALTRQGRRLEMRAERFAQGIEGGGYIGPSYHGRTARITEEMINRNGNLISSERANAIRREYPNLSADHQRAIHEAHLMYQCEVFKCTKAQLKAKLEHMIKNGVDPEIASDAIRKGLAGGIDEVPLRRADFRSEGVEDAWEEMIWNIGRREDAVENTIEAQAYYRKLKAMERAIEKGEFTIRGTAQTRFEENLNRIEDYIRRKEGEGKIAKGTMDQLKVESDGLEAAASQEAAALERQRVQNEANQAVERERQAAKAAQAQEAAANAARARDQQFIAAQPTRESIEQVTTTTTNVDPKNYSRLEQAKQKALRELDEMEAGLTRNAEQAGITPNKDGTEAERFLYESYEEIRQGRQRLNRFSENARRRLEDMSETIESSQRFKLDRIRNRIANDEVSKESYERAIRAEIKTLEKLQAEVSDYNISPGQIDNFNINDQINQLQDLLTQVSAL